MQLNAEDGGHAQANTFSAWPQPAGLSVFLPPQNVIPNPGGLKCFRPATCSSASRGGSLPLWIAFGLPASLKGAIASAIANFGALSNRLNPSSLAPSAVEVHQGGEAALSCRLCLIACNSRQFDEAEPEEQVR